MPVATRTTVARRGPKPKPLARLRSTYIGVRLRPALRQQLEAAARASDWSLSREIERRLMASFVDAAAEEDASSSQ